MRLSAMHRSHAVVAVALVLAACGGAAVATGGDAGDPPDASGETGVFDAGATDAPNLSFEAAANDAATFDASLQTGSGGVCAADDGGVGRDTCPQTPCPSGYVCAAEIGGVGGGGGSHCVPTPPECDASITCACFGTCACGIVFGRPEACSTTPNRPEYGFACDNGIR